MMFSDLYVILGGAVALLLGLLGVWKGGKSAGRKQERLEATEKDHENADRIRDDVRRNRADRLRQFDDAGYRD